MLASFAKNLQLILEKADNSPHQYGVIMFLPPRSLKAELRKSREHMKK